MSEQDKLKKTGTYTPAPLPHFSSDNRYFLTYTQALESITGTPWEQCSGSTLADVRKKVGQDLVEDPGVPEMVFLPSEYEAAQLRAEMMEEKYEDLVVTLVAKITYNKGRVRGTMRVESLRHSQVVGRIQELKEQVIDGTVKIIAVYSEEAGQLFGGDGLPIDEAPRMPKYGQKYDSKRTAIRNPTSGVMNK